MFEDIIETKKVCNKCNKVLDLGDKDSEKFNILLHIYNYHNYTKTHDEWLEKCNLYMIDYLAEYINLQEPIVDKEFDIIFLDYVLSKFDVNIAKILYDKAQDLNLKEFSGGLDLLINEGYKLSDPYVYFDTLMISHYTKNDIKQYSINVKGQVAIKYYDFYTIISHLPYLK